MRIWKFVIPWEPGEHTISMPCGAIALSAAKQGDELVMWARIPGDAPFVSEERTVLVAFTGAVYPQNDMVFLGTIQHDYGLVFHVFARESAIVFDA